jgi:phosphoglucomutase
MDFVENYLKWLSSDKIDEDTKRELMTIKDDIGEIESRFFSMLKFGTAGLRGIIGVGLNRMNVYTVRYATQGLANLITRYGKDAMNKGVCIAYDSRFMSKEFAKEAATVLAANQITVYIFDELKPTPELSFSIRYKGSTAGINITASHNPKEYNGYKVYWEDGAQLPPEHADVVFEEISKLDIFEDVKTMDYSHAQKAGLISKMGDEIDNEFLKCVKNESIDLDVIKQAGDSFKIIYTPLHGSGYKLVPKIFNLIGIKNVITVKEQMIPDCNFPTVKTPNPEIKEGFELGIALAKKENVDLIVASDPDCDRMGIVVRTRQNQYVTLSGNQVGALLADYIIKGLARTNKMPPKPVIIKTIVSSDMVGEIAKKNNVKLIDVLTGFKFIGENKKI